MKLLLVDLDDTLIDTKSFKHNLFNSIAKTYNAPLDEIQTVYQELKKEDSMANWKKRFEEGLAHTLAQNIILDRPISESISTLTLMQPTVNFMETFQGDTIIFSYGDPDIQHEKINSLRLAGKCSDIIITTDKKDVFLKTIISGERVILNNKEYTDVAIIDNDEALLSYVKNQYPWIKGINPVDLV